MKSLKLTLGAIAAMAMVPTFTAAADEANSEPKYMRSSLYTIILNSNDLNKYFEEETKSGENASELMSIAKSLTNTDAKKAANEDSQGSLFELPAKVFSDIEIPKQFNDHNLPWRVVDFDAIRATVTDDDLAKYAPKKKGMGLGKIVKSAAGMNTAGDDKKGEFDKYSRAVVAKFFNDQKVAPSLLARWYDYTHEGENHWGVGTIIERGNYNFSADDVKKAADDMNMRMKIDQTAFDMIGQTYVMAVNLRFRSYQAIVAEAAAMAKAAGGMFGSVGSLAASAATAGASAAAGDGYTVQAVTNLYRLKWNEDANQKFEADIYGKNATFDDLVNSGLCELEYIGSEKSSSNIRQSLFSDKPISSLVKRATARAIDEAIIKLQNNHKEFRTVVPILGGDGNNIYAAIGTKEGLTEKDEYEILEANEDAKGHVTYKSVGTVKAVKDKIMDNAYGASDDLSDPNISEDSKNAINRSYSEFQGKKGDYRGYFLRLKKKK